MKFSLYLRATSFQSQWNGSQHLFQSLTACHSRRQGTPQPHTSNLAFSDKREMFFTGPQLKKTPCFITLCTTPSKISPWKSLKVMQLKNNRKQYISSVLSLPSPMLSRAVTARKYPSSLVAFLVQGFPSGYSNWPPKQQSFCIQIFSKDYHILGQLYFENHFFPTPFTKQKNNTITMSVQTWFKFCKVSQSLRR